MAITKILLKLSGELLGDKKSIFSKKSVDGVIQVIKKLKYKQIYIVLGGGNIVRGREMIEFEFENGAEDNIGMLSTLQNALVLKYALDQQNCKSHVMSPISAENLQIHPYEPGKAAEWWANNNHIVILGGGIGRRGFTTDTAAVSYAYELGVDVVAKITPVGALFTADPKKDVSAKKIPRITYAEVIQKEYEIMDSTAFSFAKEKGLTVKICNLKASVLQPDTILKENHGTIITN